MSAIVTPPMPENAAPQFAYDAADTVIVVSGIPRSGTSMLMQMLAAGGIEILSDGRRPADEDNPRGYAELESVKTLSRQNDWLMDAGGKAVKIVAHLLTALHPSMRYKVIFLWRDLNEVLQSQAAMIARSEGAGNVRSDALELQRYGEVFNKQLCCTVNWLSANERVDVRYVAYADAIAQPGRTADELNAFLGGLLDVGAMAQAVRPELYRQRVRGLE